MSKRVLFLYTSPKQKEELEQCQQVFKAILRKFRKSAIFSYVQPDLSPAAYTLSEAALKKELAKNDVVLWHTDGEVFAGEEAFAKDCLGLHTIEHFAAGQCIVCAAAQKSVDFKDDRLCETFTHETGRIKSAVSTAAKAACSRKRNLTLCTDTQSESDAILFREFEYALGQEKHLNVQHISLSEMIWQCMHRIPSFDVVLTTERAANLIAMHMCGSMRIPTGYILWHTDKTRIYRRVVYPYEQMKSGASASLLLAFSAVLENEFNHKAAAAWLRRSVSLALEKCIDGICSEFLKEVIHQINKPIRNRQVKKNDSTDKGFRT